MSPERETLELDVVFVGAGPASLAGAYPYKIITWVPPEGGGGPSYGKM